MDYPEILKTVGKFGGLGGIAIALVVLFFREPIRNNIIPQLTKRDGFRWLNRVSIMSFSLGVMGLICWAILQLFSLNVGLQARTSENSIKVNELTQELSDLRALVNVVEKGRYPNLEEIDSHVELDLSGWQQVPLDKTNEKISPAHWKTTLHIRKTYDEVKSYVDDYGTSGLEPKIWSPTHAFRVTRNQEKHHRGANNLDRWLIDVDISKEKAGVSFPLEHDAIFYNSFQGIEAEWAETMAHHSGTDMVFSITFPPNKPVKSHSCYSYLYLPGEKPAVYDSAEVYVSADRTKFEWTIGATELNRIYRVDWTW